MRQEECGAGGLIAVSAGFASHTPGHGRDGSGSAFHSP